MDTRKRFFVVGVLVLGLAWLFQFFQNIQASTDSSTRNDTGKIVSSGDVGVHVLRLGDCLTLPDVWDEVGDGEVFDIYEVQGVPCTELHDAEVVGLTTLNDSSFPGTDELFDRMTSFCVSEYESYTGASFAETPHDIAPIVPTSESWTDGDRTVQCLAYNTSGEPLGASIRE